MKTSRGSNRGFTTVLSAVIAFAVIIFVAAMAYAQTAPQTLPYITTTAAGQLGKPTNTVNPAGDGGIATAGTVNGPRGVAVDSQGNIYIADTTNHVVRKVDATTGIISRIVGNYASGSPTDNTPAINNLINGPRGVFVDAAGNVWVDESSGNKIDKITPDGILHVMAKSAGCGFAGEGIVAVQTKSPRSFCNPENVKITPSGKIYFADTGNCRVAELAPSIADPSILVINTVVGVPTGVGLNVKCTTTAAWTLSPDGVDCTSATLGQVQDFAVDAVGNIYIADNTANKVRECYANVLANGARAGKMYTIAGTGRGCTTSSTPNCNPAGDGATWSGFGPSPATSTNIGNVTGLALDALGNLYISDTSNNVVWYLDMQTQ